MTRRLSVSWSARDLVVLAASGALDQADAPPMCPRADACCGECFDAWCVWAQEAAERVDR